MKVLVILGHPNHSSLCGALAEAYAGGARQSGQDVRILRLGDLAFDTNYPTRPQDAQGDEPDLAQARAHVTWADHLAFVFPNWWGMMPALLKGFIDRIFSPGFAFQMHDDGTWDRLLKGKTAQIITTMDTPGWVYRLIYGQPGINALKRATLQFCGVTPVRVLRFGTVFNSTPPQRAHWIEKARAAGRRLALGVPDRGEAVAAKTLSWIRAMRLQFYPMTWLAYTLGAGMAHGVGVFAQPVYWLGYLAVFLLEFAAVLINEYVDYDSDRRNRNFSPFNGGSRVLVDGALSFAEVRYGLAFALTGFAASGLLLSAAGGVPAATLGALCVSGVILCLGYTSPPLRFCWRGLGEVVVALTHSFLAVVCGWLLLGGPAADPLPWMLGLPLFWSILPAITLSAIPDLEADSAVGKRTLVAELGAGRALVFCMAAVVAAAAFALAWQVLGIGGDSYAGIGWFVLPHAALLLVMLQRYRRRYRRPTRINGLMATALSYILWFVAVPFWNTL
ncbi:MAG: NAD(P)H-dependent oxidoreductase [Gammaproteobacteria bacterium]|nr:NAD(P)H-dependent oxidoreductase [Gammaproteobacteria bacterium]